MAYYNVRSKKDYLFICLYTFGVLTVMGSCSYGLKKIATSSENKEAQNYIKSQCEIEFEDIEHMAQNIKSITDIKTSRNNEELFVTIKGEFKEKVNDSYSWSATYSVDDVEYSKLMEMKKLNDKIYFVCDNILPYYEPIDVKISETQMDIGYVFDSEDLKFMCL